MILSNAFVVGDVVLVNLNPSIGAEQKKTRPCMVINNHPKLDLVTVLPITDSANKKGSVFVTVADEKLAGLSKPSVVDTYQIRCLSSQRIIKKLGTLTHQEIHDCRSALALIFEIDEEHLIG